MRTDTGSSAGEGRRSFLGRLLKALGIVGTIGILYSVVSFLSRGRAFAKYDNSNHESIDNSLDRIARRRQRKLKTAGGPTTSADGTIEIAADSIPVGMYAIVSAGQVPVIVVNTSNGFKAFEATCAHLGCLVKWEEETSSFICPCHGGKYNADGKVIAGPPPRALKKWKVLKVGEKIKISAG